MTHQNRTIDEFLGDVASREVTPAGGTAAAVAGAIGTALCEMACLHTIGRAEYADVEAEMTETLDDLTTRRELLLELADEDSNVVDELFGGSHDGTSEAAAKRAAGVPLTIAEACVPVLERASVLVETGNRNVVPDAVTGSMLVRSALEASLFTVRSNLSRISDQSFVEETETRASELERAAGTEFERVLANAERGG
jgi:formiminotetrahydrofolate cyclodeaminase